MTTLGGFDQTVAASQTPKTELLLGQISKIKDHIEQITDRVVMYSDKMNGSSPREAHPQGEVKSGSDGFWDQAAAAFDRLKKSIDTLEREVGRLTDGL